MQTYKSPYNKIVLYSKNSKLTLEATKYSLFRAGNSAFGKKSFSYFIICNLSIISSIKQKESYPVFSFPTRLLRLFIVLGSNA